MTAQPARWPLAVSALLVLPLAVSVGLTACSGSTTAVPTTPPTISASAGPSGAADSPSAVATESAPPGDIPDNLAFVRFDDPGGHYSFTHPEGWAQTGTGSSVRFTDKLNAVTVDSGPGGQPLTPADARSGEVGRLSAQVPAFELRAVTQAPLPGGQSVKIVFRRDSEPDPVTGKVYRDEVEEYLVQGSDRLVRMSLTGPVGADNVDAYRTMSRSLVIR